LRRQEQLAERDGRNEYFRSFFQMGYHRAVPVQQSDDDVRIRRNLPLTGFDPFAFLFDCRRSSAGPKENRSMMRIGADLSLSRPSGGLV